ncbi:MAG TPA: hypothetical protein VLG92_02590 [Candidatus Saccharimonadia bacterium]|nr:hypothetical protein [Candidatus Saccharimonadia bacterium]
MTPPTDPEASQSEAQSYAEQLEILARSSAIDFENMLNAGTQAKRRPGEKNLQPLPLRIDRDGVPVDVLATVSIGSKVDSHRAQRPIGFPNRDGTLNAVNMAAKTYAVVRTPFSNEPAQLVELTADELTTGQCAYSSSSAEDTPGSRLVSTVPGPGEAPLELEVAISDNQHEAPAQISIATSHDGALIVNNQSGNYNAYAFVAVSV